MAGIGTTSSNQWKVLKSSGIDSDGNDDRLSSLPDDILCRILSLLQTKHVVATAVLSSRWKDLWARVSVVDLETPPISVPEDLISFCKIVERVLNLHENLHSLTRFRLQFKIGKRIDCGGAASLGYFWGRMQQQLGEESSQLEEIDVDLGTEGYGFMYSGTEDHFSVLRWLPESFFTLKNLKVLKLSEVRITSATVYSLPNLKLLQLSGAKAADCEPLNRLLSACPVLETLNMRNCCSLPGAKENIRITACSPSLRNLTILGSDDLDSDLCPVAIEAPSLEHLYLDDVNEEFELLGNGPLSCLDFAYIDIRLGCGRIKNDDVDRLIRLLSRISNAKEMFLSFHTLEFLSRTIDALSGDAVVNVGNIQLSAFPKLRHLTIYGAETSCLLHLLLNSTSRLQSLVIVLEEPWDDEDELKPFWEEELVPARTPECLLSSLEEIEIRNLSARGIEDRMKVVAYFLKVGAVLKKVNVYCAREDCNFAVAPLLQRLRRRSSNCEVHLVDDRGNDRATTLQLLHFYKDCQENRAIVKFIL